MSAASALSQPGAQCARAGERAGDHPLALLALPGQVVEERGGVGIGAGGADEDAVDRRDPCR